MNPKGQRTMGRKSTIAGFLGLLFTLAQAVVGVAPASADFASNYCDTSGTHPAQSRAVTRDQALNLEYTAVDEGYHWGGGCWNNNNKDDSPNEKLKDPDSRVSPNRGEGPDCSGLVSKLWQLGTGSRDTDDFYYYSDKSFNHPYGTGGFAVDHPWKLSITKASAFDADAFLNSGNHMGAVFAANTSSGTDLIFEAKGEAFGTLIASRTYRSDSAYEAAVRRKHWLDDDIIEIIMALLRFI